MSNEDYLQALAEKNRIKKQREQSRDQVMQKLIEDREKGFNLYNKGANEKRGEERHQQGKNEKARSSSQKRSLSTGQRRQWLAPQSNEKSDLQDSNASKPVKTYQNPFELSISNQSINPFVSPLMASNSSSAVGAGLTKKPANLPSGVRKQWKHVQVKEEQKAFQQHFLGSDLLQDSIRDEKVSQGEEEAFGKVKRILVNDESSEEDYNQKAINFLKQKQKKIEEEEEEYSDSFEALEKHEELAKQQIIEDLLKTATVEQLDVLKKSLSNFGEAKIITIEQERLLKNAGNLDLNAKVKFIGRNSYEKKEQKQESEDDYIEEDFEEDKSDSIEDLASDDVEDKLMQERMEQQEKLRKEQLRLANLAKNPQKPKRPISSTVNLSSNRVYQESQSAKNISNPKHQFANQVKDVAQAVSSENNKIKPLTRPLASAKVQKPQKINPIFQASHSNKQEEVKKPINTNPFQRPSSHVIQKSNDLNKIDQSTVKLDETNFSRAENDLTITIQPQKVDIDDVLKKIFNLDDSQRHALFQILKTLDSKGDLSGSKLNEGLSIFLQQQDPVPIKSVSSHNEIMIRVLSTLGNPHVCGLTEIEVFDEHANKINLTQSCIMIKNQGKGPKSQVDKLVNGKKLTNDEKQMWLGYLPLPPKNLEIQIRLSNDVKIGGIKIWNYNKGIFDCTKGIFQLQIFLNDTLKWEGELDPGRGYINKDFAKAIVLTEIPDFRLPVEEIEEKEETKPEFQPLKIINQLPKEEINEGNHLFIKRPEFDKQLLATENTQERLNKYRSEINLKKLEDKKPIWFEDKPGQQIESSQKRPSEFRKNLDDKKISNINNVVMQAVQSVNKAIEISNSKQAMKKPPLFEESLDNLEYFNVTNLGRLQQDSQLQITRKSNFQDSRPKWHKPEETKMDTSIAISNSSRKTNEKGPRLVSSALPDEFTPQKQRAQKSGQLIQKPQESVVQQSFEGDFLDEILNQNKKQTFIPDKITKKAQVAVQAEQQEFVLTQAESCFMPTLPVGQNLKFNIFETWGDMNYLGLTGIEIFDVDGNQIQILEANISAFPPDVNVLPGYGTDPRTVDKLIDGHYFTNDDLHVWLTPFTQGEDHTIQINLGKRTIISMIRIWNYNKSRIHSYRGAKTLSCFLDDTEIFKGEIRKAPGNTNDPEACCEIILFTENETILERIDSKDWLNHQEVATGFDNTQRISDMPSENGFNERPMTATKKFNTTEIEEIQFQLQQQSNKPTSLFDARPQTSALGQKSTRIGDEVTKINFKETDAKKQVNEQKKEKTSKGKLLKGKTLQINIKESWGDLFYVGLNGLHVIDENGEPIKITVVPEVDQRTGIPTHTRVFAEPRDMNSIPGHGQDHRTLEKLFNGKDNTTDDRNMWLIPFNKGENHMITIDFGQTKIISAVRFYNYNKSLEDTLRGAKQVIIKLDKQLVTPKKGITLRKAPGFMEQDVDIAQDIKIPFMQGWTNDQIVPIQRAASNPINFFQEYEPITLPIGFNFKFNIYSTHGDMYYVGLNGIELFDQNGRDLFAVLKGQYKVVANPPGVHTIKGMENDIRRVENLVDGSNMTSDDNHIWLSQFKNTKCPASVNVSGKDDEQAKKREPNFVIFMFDEPVALSVVRIWNYSKTPHRGVNEFEIEVDGLRVFRGYARKAPDEIGSFSTKVRDWSTVAIFGGEEDLIQKYARQIYFDPLKRQNVLLINERKVIQQQVKSLGRDQNFILDERQRPQTKAKNPKD